MTTPKPPQIIPAQNPTTTQTPVPSNNAAADAAAIQKKAELKNETSTKKSETSAKKSILTSGAGVLDDTKLKKNTLLGG